MRKQKTKRKDHAAGSNLPECRRQGHSLKCLFGKSIALSERIVHYGVKNIRSVGQHGEKTSMGSFLLINANSTLLSVDKAKFSANLEGDLSLCSNTCCKLL